MSGLGSGSGPAWAVLGANQGLSWRSWERIRDHVGGLGSGSGTEFTILGADQDLRWRSWAVLGPKWSVLARDHAEKWPKPKREVDLARGSGPKSGPNPSGKAVLGRGSFSIVFGARDLLSIF